MDMPVEKKIVFELVGRSVEALEGETILEVADRSATSRMVSPSKASTERPTSSKTIFFSTGISMSLKLLWKIVNHRTDWIRGCLA